MVNSIKLVAAVLLLYFLTIGEHEIAFLMIVLGILGGLTGLFEDN